jgi:hypothetical protein
VVITQGKRFTIFRKKKISKKFQTCKIDSRSVALLVIRRVGKNDSEMVCRRRWIRPKVNLLGLMTISSGLLLLLLLLLLQLLLLLELALEFEAIELLLFKLRKMPNASLRPVGAIWEINLPA